MPQSSVTRAMLWMVGWLAATFAMTISARELAHDVPVFVIMILRSVMAVIMLAPFIALNGGLKGRLSQFRLHLVRNFIHYAAQYAWFSALALIAMGQVVAIEFTMPMWIAILAALFLGERLTGPRIFAVILGFAGILFIVKPGVVPVETGHIVALLAALGFAAAITLTKFITRADSPLTVIFLMFAIQTVIGAVPAWVYWQWPQPQNWVWVVAIGITGTFSHFCLAKAVSLADATLVMPLDFLRVPLTALAGYWLFAERFDATAVVGAVLILGANAINLFGARRAL
ncbi:DMT family transporter [soil metagenome]